MSEMVERVAKAIVARIDVMDGCGSTWDAAPASAKEEAFIIARAAIEAMREPTEPMIQRGWELLRGNLRPDEIYPHMIDEALRHAVSAQKEPS